MHRVVYLRGWLVARLWNDGELKGPGSWGVVSRSAGGSSWVMEAVEVAMCSDHRSQWSIQCFFLVRIQPRNDTVLSLSLQ